MKRRLVIALTALMVFGLAIAVVAFSSSTNVSTVAACCCCSGDSCPMKSKSTTVKDASAKDEASCCEGCEHCKGGAESCPMMKDGAHKGDHAKSGHSCCPMMKDAAHKDGAAAEPAKHSEHVKTGAMSCPMKGSGEVRKADDPSIALPVAAAGDKEGCNCACCAGHDEKQTVPAV